MIKLMLEEGLWLAGGECNTLIPRTTGIPQLAGKFECIADAEVVLAAIRKHQDFKNAKIVNY